MLAPFLYRPALSLVIPVHDESGNIAPLISEVHAALAGRVAYELVYVDDASGDDSAAQLLEAMRSHPELRVVRHVVNSGQSAALATGVRHARAPVIVTLDGDGQNDPADIPALWQRWQEKRALQPASQPLLLTGWRVERHDDWLRRVSSRVANGVRSRLLGDATPDTGCGLKMFEREVFLRLPFFDHLHRFLPALVLREGGRVESVPVRHRPRGAGRSHYGVWNRLGVGVVDLLGIMWLRRRMKTTPVVEMQAEATAAIDAR